MSSMDISLPEDLKNFVDDQVSARGYRTSSEYVRELIWKDRDRQRLRGLLLEGAESPKAVAADAHYFEGLRSRVRHVGLSRAGAPPNPKSGSEHTIKREGGRQ